MNDPERVFNSTSPLLDTCFAWNVWSVCVPLSLI